MNNPSNDINPRTTHRGFGYLSLRLKISIAILGIVFLSLATFLGFFLLRAQSVSNVINTRFEQSVINDAENLLSITTDKEANTVANFFSDINDAVNLISLEVEKIISEETTMPTYSLNESITQRNLVRLENGSWDNPNTDAGSFFLPSNLDITPTVLSELVALDRLDDLAQTVIQLNPNIIAVYFGSEQGATLYYPNIDLASILPPDFDVTQRPWYLDAEPSENEERRIVWSVPYLDAALNGLVLTGSAPIYDETGSFRGVIGIDVQITQVTELVESIRLERTGYAFLIDFDGHVISMPQDKYGDFGLDIDEITPEELINETILRTAPFSAFDILSRMTSGQKDIRTITLGDIEYYIAFQRIPIVNYSLGVMVPIDEMNAPFIEASEELTQEINTTGLNMILVAGGTLTASLIIAILISNFLTRSLIKLTNTADEIAKGNLETRVDITSKDELGTLGQTLNTMAGVVQETVASLEERVRERTANLEETSRESQRRAEYLETINDVTRSIATEQDLDTLLPSITRLVSDRFGFYHVGIFLLDETENYAVLRASNSEGGQRMLKRGHRLKVGEAGIVGYVSERGEGRIALDVGQDAVFFDNPDLPETRSEMALPLIVDQRVIGALDVQSREAQAFSQADIEILNNLSEQLAIAIDKARLLDQTKQSLAETQRLLGEFSLEQWRSMMRSKNLVGYSQQPGLLKPLTERVMNKSIEQALTKKDMVLEENPRGEFKTQTIAVPIKLRDQILGIINVKSTHPEHRLSQREITILQAAAERIALALENARLFEQAQERVLREQTLAEITSKISSSINLNNLLQIAVEELGNAIPGAEVVVQLQDAEKRNK